MIVIVVCRFKSFWNTRNNTVVCLFAMVTTTATHEMSQHPASTIANTTITDCFKFLRYKTTGYIMDLSFWVTLDKVALCFIRFIPFQSASLNK